MNTEIEIGGMIMKFCGINQRNEMYFKPFMSSAFYDSPGEKSLSLGIFDGNTPLGAALLYVDDGKCEVRSLEYSEELKVGECEKALVDFIKGQKWDIYAIEYIAGGAPESLDEYDFTMMEAGFVPMRGDVSKYQATLFEISKAQEETINKFKARSSNYDFKLGKDLTDAEINAYNKIYPANRYIRNKYNQNLSCFMFLNGEIRGGITLREANNVLEFQWMDASRMKIQDTMKLIVYATVNAMDKCPMGTEVIICPFSEEVKGLITRFGFKEVAEKIDSRIYTYYLEA